MFALPLQLVDTFLLQYNVGQVLLLAFALSLLGVLPFKSRKAISLLVIVFGLVFLMTPTSLQPQSYQFLGIALLVVGPMLFVTAKR